MLYRKSLLPEEPDRIDLVDVIGTPNARGRLITGSQLYGVGKKYKDFYRPDSDGKFRWGTEIILSKLLQMYLIDIKIDHR